MDIARAAFPFVRARPNNFHLNGLCKRRNKQVPCCHFVHLSAHLLCFSILASALGKIEKYIADISNAAANLEKYLKEGKTEQINPAILVVRHAIQELMKELEDEIWSWTPPPGRGRSALHELANHLNLVLGECDAKKINKASGGANSIPNTCATAQKLDDFSRAAHQELSRYPALLQLRILRDENFGRALSSVGVKDLLTRLVEQVRKAMDDSPFWRRVNKHPANRRPVAGSAQP